MYYTALIGNPTEHSVSHILYEELIKAAGIDVAYKHLKIDVTEPSLAEAVNALKVLHFAGISVTLPHKLAVMKYLDDTDDEVKELGAVNTIKVGPKLIGHNTDWRGIAIPVRRVIPEGIEQATILGTGGAARAAIYACKQLGVSIITVIYREDSNDEKLANLKVRADYLGISLFEYKDVAALIRESDLIINATSAGMRGKDSTPFSLHELDGISLQDKLFFDVVFNPLKTPLLEYFGSRGAQTIDGLWMMIYQGISALGIWLDQEIEVERSQLETIHKKLEEELHHV